MIMDTKNDDTQVYIMKNTLVDNTNSSHNPKVYIPFDQALYLCDPTHARNATMQHGRKFTHESQDSTFAGQL